MRDVLPVDELPLTTAERVRLWGLREAYRGAMRRGAGDEDRFKAWEALSREADRLVERHHVDWI